VSENRVLRRTFGTKREDVAGGWRRLHNEELHKSYAVPDIIRVIKSKRMTWAGHVACIVEMRTAYRIGHTSVLNTLLFAGAKAYKFIPMAGVS